MKATQVIFDKQDSLMHYGMPRRSGRYPWGSGEDPYQHDDNTHVGGRDFLARVDELKKNGWEETPENIKKEFGLTTTQYRTEKSICRNERRALDVAKAKSLADHGLGPSEIAKRMTTTEKKVNESTVRSWLNEDSEHRMKEARAAADFIKTQVDKNKMVDVSSGVERELNISATKLNTALYLLEREGYNVVKGGIPQVTTQGQQTNQRVILAPDVPVKTNDKGQKVSSAIYDFDKVHALNEDDYISRDGGETFEKKFHYPESMSSKRLMIRYADDKDSDGFTGVQKDGTIEIRRGVADLSLGESKYAQVRILVDGTHYVKGMAVYSDDMPDGVDVVFNTNKKKGTPALGPKDNTVLKNIKADPENPFGSAIKDVEQGGQYWYTDKKTGTKKLGLINKRADEGDWGDWSDTLPSQFLSKQSLSLAKRQLDIDKSAREVEFESINSLTLPTVKKYLLNKFAQECDSAAVQLKAAALPGQKYNVIIPNNSLKETEVYAPGYENGTKLALIRYPHGGTFEIPICTVNNKNALGKKLIGTTPQDAICINSKVAERLSGADFDGDTVMCIPTHDKGGKVKIISKSPLKQLEGFDPKAEYQFDKHTVDADGTDHYYRNGHEFKKMNNTQKEMGVISNLITDMTLSGNATDEELARAVKHSMVVIDAEKHVLDYKQSELDNNIRALKQTYQRTIDEDGNVRIGGASTIISKAGSQISVTKRQGTPKINIKGEDWYDPSRPEGALIYKDADDAKYTITKTNKRTGATTTVEKTRHQQSVKMAETDDAYTLLSAQRHPMELVYADYANDMKTLANKARVELYNTPKVAVNKAAKSTYKNEVDSLNDKLNNALLNAPRERQSQRLANARVKARQEAYKAETGEDMKKSDVKKVAQQEITKARIETNTQSRRERNINITDKEWEAIQAGAVSENTLTKILNNTDIDKLRERATPHTATKALSNAKINQIKNLSGTYTIEQIATKLGISTSTVRKYLKGN